MAYDQNYGEPLGGAVQGMMGQGNNAGLFEQLAKRAGGQFGKLWQQQPQAGLGGAIAGASDQLRQMGGQPGAGAPLGERMGQMAGQLAASQPLGQRAGQPGIGPGAEMSYGDDQRMMPEPSEGAPGWGGMASAGAALGGGGWGMPGEAIGRGYGSARKGEMTRMPPMTSQFGYKGGGMMGGMMDKLRRSQY